MRQRQQCELTSRIWRCYFSSSAVLYRSFLLAFENRRVDADAITESAGRVRNATCEVDFFYYLIGYRPKVVRAIIWDWVTLDEGMIHPLDNTTKNGEYLPMPISQEFVKILRKRFHNGPLFITTNFRKVFRTVC